MPDTSSASVPPPSASTSSDGFRLSDLLRFEKMLTPRLAKVGFYIGGASAVLVGLVLLYGGATARYGGGGQAISGLAVVVFGPFLLRVACEQIIVIFGIYERLGQIRDQEAGE